MDNKFRRISFFTKYKIKRQLYLMYAAVVVIPVALIGMFLLVYTYQMMVNYHTDMLDSDNRRVRNILFEITTQIYNISENISFDNGIREVLTGDFADRQEYMEAVAGNGLLDNYEKTYTEIYSVEIYTDNPALSEYKQFRPVSGEIEELPWYQKAISQSGVFWKELSWEDGNGNRYWNLCLIRKIPLVDSPYHAVLVLRISDNYLRTRVDNSEYISMVSVDKGPILYSSDREKYGLAQPWMIDYDQPYFRYVGRARIEGERCFINVSALNTYQSDSRIYVCSLDRQGYGDILSILNICCVLLLVALTIPGFMIRYFAGNFTERVGVLRQEMHKASRQDYELISTFQGNDELSEAFDDLQVMVQNIKEQEARAYEAQIKEQELMIRQQEMEFKMLASQINPHFLYNTLETIRMKAFTAGDKEAATAIKLLGQSMRYVLENTGNHETTLKEALDHVNVYMKIQHLRFGERIQYETKIEEGLHPAEYNILPLLLQPVVENAIVHGLEEKEDGGRILLSVYSGKEENAGLLVIDVEDNGCGMTQETLDKLHEDIAIRDMSRSKSIGLYNINQRMKLHYGDGYSLHIYASPGRGTRVRLMIPAENTGR
ncbi:MAG: sensor histidine kinase [Ruminococcus sp.]|nr:sensor histidine kinase [Ruminococcus sp.]